MEKISNITAILLLVVAIPAFASALDLNAGSITDIQNNCPYFPNSHTYYCTENIVWSPSGNAIINETDGVPVLSYPAGTTFADKSYSNTFTGANSPTITAGGTCDPKDVSIDINGICQGTSTKSYGCGSGMTITNKYGTFLRHTAGASASGSCFVGSCSVWVSNICSNSQGTNGYGGLSPSCSGSTTTENIYMGGGYSSNCAAYGCGWFSCGVTTYYIPCTLSPTVRVNNMFFQYSGLIYNTSTITVPLANLKPGANNLQMSALESGKFNYNLKWTEVNAPGPCLTSQKTKAYHITSGNIYQSGNNARIMDGKFAMRFDSVSTDTSVSLLKDYTNPLVSARISQYDGSNLKLEIYDGIQWNTLANNIQPNVWYNFSLNLNEAGNTVALTITSAEYPTISQTFSIPAGSPAISWISVSSNGAWLDNVNIVKKDISGGIISAYVDDFESYNTGDSVLYGSGGFDNITITSDIGIDSYDGYNVKNIVLKAKNNLKTKTISASGVGCGGHSGSSCDYGSVGNIELQGRNVTFDRLISSCPNVGEPEDSYCNAGSIKLKGNNISGSEIQALGGYDCSNNVGGCYSYICWGKRAGSATIEGNSTDIGTINLYATPTDRNSNGGTATIKSDAIKISAININSNSGQSGGSGGSATIKGAIVDVGAINAYGGSASGDPWCGGGQTGSGGAIDITARNYVNIPGISANVGSGYSSSPGGSIKVSAGKIVSFGVSAVGGQGVVGTYGSKGEIVGNPASAGGSVRIYADSVDSSLSVSNKGGNAKCINTGGTGYCAISTAGTGGLLAIFNDTALSGTVTLDNSGGNGANCASVDRPDCKTGSGSSGAYQPNKRTWPGFLGLNTSTYDTSFNTYEVKVRNMWTNEYAKQRNNTALDYTYNWTLIKTTDNNGVPVAKIGDALIGFRGSQKFDMALGKDYQLEINMSLCNPFTDVLCSHTGDKVYVIPFVQY
ncbi:Uncharacterised protein [uncultured archaeon]|nr:Uncharacterised protein [uncultured archaeon]